MDIISKEIVGQFGDNSISGRINFKVVSWAQLTDKHLKAVQTELGYSPYGYDFFWGKEIRYKIAGNPGMVWQYTWSCAANCD